MKSWLVCSFFLSFALVSGACDGLGGEPPGSEPRHDQALYPSGAEARFQVGPAFVLENATVRNFFTHMALVPRPDGSLLVSGAPGSPATLWRYTPEGTLVEEIDPPALCQEQPCYASATSRGIVFSRLRAEGDGSNIVSTDLDGTVRAELMLPPTFYALPDGSLLTVDNGQGVLTRYDADGTPRWTQTGLPERFRSVALHPDGGLVVAGYIRDGEVTGLGGVREEMVVVRLGAQGEVLWTKHFDDCLSCNVLQIRPLDDGSFFLYASMKVTPDGRNYSDRPWLLVLGDDGAVLADSEAWAEPPALYHESRRFPAWAALDVVQGTRESVEIVIDQNRLNRPPRTLRIDPDSGVAVDYEWPLSLGRDDGLCYTRTITRADAGEMVLLLDCQAVSAFSGIGSGRYWLDVLVAR